MGIYSAIFRKLTGKEKKTKKRKPMAKKKLTPEQKKARRQKITASLKKVGGKLVKYSSGKPTVKVTAKKVTPPAPTEKKEAVNFWNSPIDMGFIKPTGKQLVIGGTATLLGGALIYKAVRK